MYDQFSDLRVPIAPDRSWLRWLERPIAVAISGLAGFSLLQMLGLQPSVEAVPEDTTGALHHAVLALLLPGLVGVLALLSAARHHSGFAAILAMICLSGLGYGVWLLGGPELIAKPDIALAQLQYATASPAALAELPLGAIIALAGLGAMQVGLMVLFITRSLGRAYAVLLLLLCAAAPVAALLAPTTG